MSDPRKEILSEDRPYHIFSRAVEKREVFDKEEDCYRFVFQMYAANIGSSASSLCRRDVISLGKAVLAGENISSTFVAVEHPPLVYLLSFSLVVNHNHFCLVPNTKDGIPKYMQKLNAGFAKYFNLKYDRRGALFESRYNFVPITDSFQFDAIIRYINITNPLDVFQAGWRENGLNNNQAAMEFLMKYPFSSFSNIFGERSSHLVAPPKILEQYGGADFFRGKKENFEFVKDFLRDNRFCSTSEDEQERRFLDNRSPKNLFLE